MNVCVCVYMYECIFSCVSMCDVFVFAHTHTCMFVLVCVPCVHRVGALEKGFPEIGGNGVDSIHSPEQFGVHGSASSSSTLPPAYPARDRSLPAHASPSVGEPLHARPPDSPGQCTLPGKSLSSRPWGVLVGAVVVFGDGDDEKGRKTNMMTRRVGCLVLSWNLRIEEGGGGGRRVGE